MGLIFLRNRVSGAAPFSPLSLFASGEEGVWYEPSTTTAFLSTTDLTPCDYGQSAGFLLDLSKGAGYSGGSFTGTVEQLTNGDFSTGDFTGWSDVGTSNATYAVTAGAAVITRGVGAAGAGIYQDISVSAGDIFVFSVDVEAVTGTAQVAVFGAAAFTPLLSQQNVLQGNTTTITGSIVVTTQTTLRLYLNLQSKPGEGVFDNATFALIPGNHATQGTAAARPILARVPSGGRRNLLNDTENFVPATSNWEVIALNSTLPTVLANQDGDADRVTFGTIDAANDLSILRYPVEALTTIGLTYTISVELKANDATQIGKTVFFYQNDATGILTYTAHTLTSDYVRVSVTGAWAWTTRFISLATEGGSRFGGEGALTDTDAVVLVRSVQLEAASSASAYQKVVDQYDITEAGVTSLEYLAFDGSDDSLSVSMSEAAGPVSIFAAAQSDKTTDPQYIIDIETGRLFLGFNATGSNSGIYDGSVFVAASLTITNTTVLSGIARTSAILRANGSQVASGTITQRAIGGAINIGNRFASSTAPLDGRIFGLIIRASDSTTQEISNTEAYLANRSGVTLP